MRIIEEIVDIKSIEKGDYIKSFDIVSERSRYNIVNDVLAPSVQKDNQVLFRIKGSTTLIITSLNHPMCYYNYNTNTWSYKPSAEIEVNDVIKAEDKVSQISEVHLDYSEEERFIDFEVAIDNNYYVSNDAKDFYVIHNSRPGACSVYFSWWHLDAPEMIELKEEGGTEDRRARRLQYGIKWNKLFTERIINNQEITLFDPKETPKLLETSGQEFEDWYAHYENKPKIRKRKMKAVDLAYAIAKQRIETGNLYLFFEENVQKQNVFNRKIHSSNLCNEIYLPTEAPEFLKDNLNKDLSTGEINLVETSKPGLIALCNLSSINLIKFMNLSYEERAKVAYNLLRASDNLIDYGYYPAKEGEIFNKNYRAIGVGITNYAQFLAVLGFSWESEDALVATNDIMEDIYWHLMNASIQLARERGRYQEFYNSKYSQGEFTFDNYCGPYNYDLRYDWDGLRTKLVNSGTRFSTLMAIAPTATSSLIMNSTEGAEPIRKLISMKTGTYSCTQLAPNLRQLRENYDIAWNIKPDSMINLASVRQRWLDQGQSTSLYYKDRNQSAYEVLADIIKAEKAGLKGLYYAHSPKEDDEIEEGCESCSA